MEITVENLFVRLGKKEILKGVSLEVANGEFVGIIGPNGCGKSTLLKSIYRVIRPDRGSIKINNKLIENYSLKESAKQLGVMTQNSNFNFDFTVEEVIMMGRTPHKKLMEADNDEDFQIVEDSLIKVGMQDFRERHFNTLSGGERQRVLIARALTGQPKMLILDEPTNHLDIHYQISLLELVSGLNIEILAAMHDLNLAAAYCDRIYVMKSGEIVAFGSPEEVLTKGLLREVFNVEAQINSDQKTGKINIVYQGI